MSDPFSAAIDAAVARAVEAQMPKILEAIKARPVADPARDQPDRLVRMSEAANLLGVHRVTLHRMEKAGKLPPRRRIGSASGYLMSDILRIQQGEAA